MQITFLVGNGFDISCGLHTSYQDFYDWYCAQEKSEKEYINQFREDIKLNKQNWSDFEEAIGKYTSKFTKATVGEYLDCYEDAHEKLRAYLEKETARFEEEIPDESVRIVRQGLKKFYSELNPQEVRIFDGLFQATRNQNSTISFISFNYTDTLDRCVEAVATEPLDSWRTSGGACKFSVFPEIIHAHGRLNRHPIFGVNDETQIQNKELLDHPDFDRLMVKPKCVEAVGELWHEEANRLIDNSTIICIFGMSMGITDTVWFTHIMEWLNDKADRQVIIYWHTNDPSDGRSNRKYLANIREAQSKLTDYSSFTRAQIDQLNQRIHVVENTKSVLCVKLKEKK